MNNKNELGTLLLRVVLGLVFLVHGAAKFQGGIENTAGWFDSIGIPGVFAYAVAGIEFAGGLAMILGIGTRIVALLFGLIMIGAIITVNFSLGFLEGYVFDLVLLIISLHIVLNGSKLLSLGQVLSSGRSSN